MRRLSIALGLVVAGFGLGLFGAYHVSLAFRAQGDASDEKALRLNGTREVLWPRSKASAREVFYDIDDDGFLEAYELHVREGDFGECHIYVDLSGPAVARLEVGQAPRAVLQLGFSGSPTVKLEVPGESVQYIDSNWDGFLDEVRGEGKAPCGKPEEMLPPLEEYRPQDDEKKQFLSQQSEAPPALGGEDLFIGGSQLSQTALLENRMCTAPGSLETGCQVINAIPRRWECSNA